MTTPPMATMPAKAGPKRIAAAKPTVSDSDMLPSRLDDTAQRSLVTAAARKTRRSIQWSRGKVCAVASMSTPAATADEADVCCHR